jgi:hypothetical protein
MAVEFFNSYNLRAHQVLVLSPLARQSYFQMVLRALTICRHNGEPRSISAGQEQVTAWSMMRF